MNDKLNLILENQVRLMDALAASLCGGNVLEQLAKENLLCGVQKTQHFLDEELEKSQKE